MFGYDGMELTRASFQEQASNGCSGCGDPAGFYDELSWYDDYSYFCGSCALEPYTESYMH